MSLCLSEGEIIVARIGISKEDVVQAAEILLAEGKSPTVIQVRQMLGNTGSNTTINKHLSEWKIQKLTSGFNVSSEQVSIDNKRGSDFHWLNQKTQKTFSLLEKQYESRIQSMMEMQERLSDKLHQAEIKCQGLRLEKEALKVELSDTLHQLQCDKRKKLSNDFTTMEEQRALKQLIQKLYVEQSHIIQKIDKLHSQFEDTDKIFVQNAEQQVLVQTMAKLTADNEQLEQALKQVKSDNTYLRTALNKMESENKYLRESLEMLRDKLLELEML